MMHVQAKKNLFKLSKANRTGVIKTAFIDVGLKKRIEHSAHEMNLFWYLIHLHAIIFDWEHIYHIQENCPFSSRKTLNFYSVPKYAHEATNVNKYCTSSLICV